MHRRTRIKMCGITNIADAEEGIRAGVDALGFIFVQSSPRYIVPEKVKQIVAGLPPFVDLVGVFVDQENVEVQEIIHCCGLSYVQLHGSETPEYCSRLADASSPCKIIKAFRVGGQSVPADFTPYQDVVQGFLLDTYAADQVGGTGKTFDWAIIGSLALGRPIILAGGLTPQNVGVAIKEVQPFAIDINSGVEMHPGCKDYRKLQALLAEVRRADLARIS
ncbi:MAG: phosphoribosylanthranilate isomerase [Desulfoprunum sp.]|nr:phosphoribosylanthranilate isomerase [Desulfoprunum sp.]